jgi:hypothetical protein
LEKETTCTSINMYEQRDNIKKNKKTQKTGEKEKKGKKQV